MYITVPLIAAHTWQCKCAQNCSCPYSPLVACYMTVQVGSDVNSTLGKNKV